jgi:hypothetical protein
MSVISTEFHYNRVKLRAAVTEVVVARVPQYQHELGYARNYKNSHLVNSRYLFTYKDELSLIIGSLTSQWN